ncbi:MAG: bifunctional oligoribonuclease/PAP phosphatase NrnA [Bacteroidota bacterium]|nr:bifunctional oligoribonuclease/PAP phosphatase NrnA [Bacteroidota bacterium]
MENNFLSAFKRIISTQKKIVIIPHRNPDGDALGSALALKHFLEAKKHKVNIVSPNDYPTFLKWLPGESDIIKFSKKPSIARDKINNAELIFGLDFNSLSRIQDLSEIVKKTNVDKIMIDHHESPEFFANLNYSDPSMSSTCEMVYNIINASDSKLLDKKIACCLYTGIMTDTGSFRYPSTTSKTHQVVSHLLSLGANSSEIHQKIFDSSSMSRIKLLGISLSNLVKIPDLPVVYITLSKEELVLCDFKKGDTEGFVNYGLSLKGVNFSCMMIENENEGKIKMSFRSQGNFSVDNFARNYFNGGGHLNAAGGVSTESLDKTIIRFKNALKNHIPELT